MDVRGRPRAARRALALAGAFALAAVSSGALAQTTAPGDDTPGENVPYNRGIARVCPAPGDDGGAVTPPDDDEGARTPPDDALFSDATGVHAEAIECAGDYLLVSGYDDGTYRPDGPISRAQMARFVANWVETATGRELVFDDDVTYFPDATGTHADAIRKLAEAGIVAGRTDGTYGPAETVNRGQMTRFLANAIDYVDTFVVDGSLPPTTDTDVFEDVADSTFVDDIHRLADVGIVEGDADGDFGVGRDITRDQMAAFVMRGADYADREQRWAPTAVVGEYLVDLSGLNVVDEDGEAGEGQLGVRGSATVTVDAYEGLLEYEIDVSEFNDSYATSGGVAIHLGDAGENGEEVVPLASASELANATDGIVTGTVSQLDVTYRFADLIEDPAGHYLLVTSDGYPQGSARGQLAEDAAEEPDDTETADESDDATSPATAGTLR